MNKITYPEADDEPQAIRQLLNRSLGQIGQPALSRLHDARKLAMSHYGTHRTSPVYAWAGLGHGHGTHKIQYWAAAVLLAATLLGGIAYWQHVAGPDACDTCDTDIAILTDDLPVYVYTD